MSRKNKTVPKDFFTWSKLSLLEYLLLKSKEHGVSLAWIRLFYVWMEQTRGQALFASNIRKISERG